MNAAWPQIGVMMDVSTQLVKVLQSNNLPETKAAALEKAFTGYFTDATTAVLDSQKIEVTDVSQIGAMKAARASRLRLREIRVAAEKTRKTLKEESLREGKAIDGVNNLLCEIIEPEEKRLQDMEDFAAKKEADRIAALVAGRAAQLSAVRGDPNLYKLAEMDDAAFAKVLDAATTAHTAAVEAERKAEAERIAAEEARKAEEARVRAENERLRKEAEEREQAMKAERAEADRRAREAEEAARAEREKIEAEARKEREALQAKAREDQKAAEEKARKEREAVEAKAKAEREKAEKEAREAERLRKQIELSASELLTALRDIVDESTQNDNGTHTVPSEYIASAKVKIANATRK